jgi:hypothetical protein
MSLLLAGASGCGGSSTQHTSASTPPAKSSSSPASTSRTTPAPGGGAVTASAGSGFVASASAGGVTATLTGATHSPKANSHWPVRITVTRDGRPARASVEYQYLLGSQVVAHRSHYTFKGTFNDVFVWPPAAAGYPLTFRALVSSGAWHFHLDYPVQVHR